VADEITRTRRGPLSVVEAGDPAAPALVLLHGIGSSGDAFMPQAPAVAERWRVLAPDAPGYGASDDPIAAPGIDGFADAVARLLDDTGIDQAVLLGASWGGPTNPTTLPTHPPPPPPPPPPAPPPPPPFPPFLLLFTLRGGQFYSYWLE